MKKLLAHFLFLIIIIGDLYGTLFEAERVEFVFKPLILIWICGYFLMLSKGIDRRVIGLTVTAFSFSWLGDVLLMFTGSGEQFFVLGLFAFFCAQLIYIFLFLHTIKLSGKKSFLKKKPYLLITYIAFGLVLYIVLYNYLDPILRISVFVYMVALLGMSAMALNRFGNGHPVSFTYVFSGSVLFVISDSLIALDKFVVNIPFNQLFVMVTYIGAQYLIMSGILKQYELAD